MTTVESPSPALNDADLVARSLAGDPDAFRGIVTRYQSLVCAVTYSGTGDVRRSEEIAQDAFVEAWKKLPALREPGKLRSWLCSIARHLTSNTRRRDAREPAAGAEPLGADAEFPAAGLQPADSAAAADEQAILWSALERVPEIYREPLILYYREGQSARAVAEALGSNEEAVRQQLSRGRLLLRDEVMAYVERGLQGSIPGSAFTGAVMTSVGPMIAGAKLGAVSGTLTGTAAKLTAMASTVASVAGLATGVAGAYLGCQVGLAQATSEPERRLVRSFFRHLVLGLVVFFAGFGLLLVGWRTWHFPLVGFVGATTALALAYSTEAIVMSLRHSRRVKSIRAAQPARAPRRYRSRASFLGLPLIHIDLDTAGPVCGWIAAGNARVYGGLFALGGAAFAPIAIGGFAFGLVSAGGIACGGLAFGGLSLGGASVGGLAAGWDALGGCAFGYNAVGGCAVAWHTAAGALAEARDFAIGSAAFASHANDAATHALAARHPRLLSFAAWAPTHLYFVSLAWMIPLLAWTMAIRWLNRRNFAEPQR